MSIKRMEPIVDPARREFLRKSFAGMGGAGGTGATMSNLANLGPLQDPDENGLRLPEGFTSRIIGRSGKAVAETGYTWHNAPDGGTVFTTDDAGWIYVSNSETAAIVGGGASAMRFSASGDIVGAYRLLGDTDLNCAGGGIPWGTWLSCEETPGGRVRARSRRDRRG